MPRFTAVSKFGNDIAIVKAGSRYHLSLIFEFFAITFYIIYRAARRITHNNRHTSRGFLLFFFYRAILAELIIRPRALDRAARKRAGLVSELRNYLPHIGRRARAS